MRRMISACRLSFMLGTVVVAAVALELELE
jgi:hypothetical protein